MYLTGRLRAPLKQRGFALLLMTGRPGPLVGPVQICTEQNGDTLFALLASVALLSLEIKLLRRQHFVENPVSSALYTRCGVLFQDVCGVGRNPQGHTVGVYKSRLAAQHFVDDIVELLEAV